MRKIFFLLFVLIIMLVSTVGFAENESQLDFEGETVTYIDFWNRFGSDTMERLKNEAEDKFNVEIKMRTPGNIKEEVRARVLAGDAEYDVINVMSFDFWDLASDGLLYPVGDILKDEHYEDYNFNLSRMINKEYFYYNGQFYGFLEGEVRVDDVYFIIYNQTMFEDQGLDTPYELWKRDEWTWQKMKETAEKLTTEDQYGLKINVDHLAFSNGAQLIKETENGIVEFAFDEEPAIEAMKFFMELDDMGVIGEGFRDEFENGEIGMLSTVAWQVSKNRLEDIEDDYGFAPLPKGPNVEEHQVVLDNPKTWMLPVSVKEPNKLAKLTDFLFPSPSDEEFKKRMIDVFATDQNDYEVLLHAAESSNVIGPRAQIIMGPFYMLADGDEPLPKALRKAVIDREVSPEAAMTEVKPEIQSIIDDYFN